MSEDRLEKKFASTIQRLHKVHGPQNWWPHRFDEPTSYPFEVALGAILTQNTSWSNVDKALTRLIEKDWTQPGAFVQASLEELEDAIQSAGYFRQKAKKLKLFSRWVMDELGGELQHLKNYSDARERLLALWGIGPETADTILLYALDRPSFVVDAYTRRLFVQLTGDHAWLKRSYDEIRLVCETALGEDAGTNPLAPLIRGMGMSTVKCWQEAHALIVRWGKEAGQSWKLSNK